MPPQLAPRPSNEILYPNSTRLEKPRKISTACMACKHRKTKCSGGEPCDACASRSSDCIYDVGSDQRRKLANQRNLDDLKEARANLERHQQLLFGIISTIKSGDTHEVNHLISLIKSGVDLSQLEAHLKHAVLANVKLKQTCEALTFEMSGPPTLPTPSQLLENPLTDGFDQEEHGFSESSFPD